MDWYPLINSLRIAGISSVIVFFLGICAAYYIARAPRLIKGILSCTGPVGISGSALRNKNRFGMEQDFH